MSVGNISSIDSPSTTHSVAGTLHKLAPGSIVAPDIQLDAGRSVPTSWAFGTGSGQINQWFDFIFSATANTTTTLDFSGTAGNVNRIGDLLATLTAIKYMKFEFLSSVQDTTNGSNALISGATTIGVGGTHGVIVSPLGSTGTYAMKVGSVWIYQEPVAGFAIVDGATDTFDFVNADTTYAAKFRITILGLK